MSIILKEKIMNKGQKYLLDNNLQDLVISKTPPYIYVSDIVNDLLTKNNTEPSQ